MTVGLEADGDNTFRSARRYMSLLYRLRGVAKNEDIDADLAEQSHFVGL